MGSEMCIRDSSELDSRRASGLSEHAQISSKLESETQTRTRLESEVRHVTLCDVSLHATRLIQPVLVLVFENLRWHSKLVVCNFFFVFFFFSFLGRYPLCDLVWRSRIKNLKDPVLAELRQKGRKHSYCSCGRCLV